MSQDVEMSVFEAILARRSVRSYTEDPVDGAVLQTLLEAAVRAPTSMQQEPWAFIQVQDRRLLGEISENAKPLYLSELRHFRISMPKQSLESFADPQFNIFHGAGTLVVICASSLNPMAVADCWLAAQNLMLAACAMKLGTCVVGMALPALNMATFKAQLGIPERYAAIAPIAIGHPLGETQPTSRRRPMVLASTG